MRSSIFAARSTWPAQRACKLPSLLWSCFFVVQVLMRKKRIQALEGKIEVCLSPKDDEKIATCQFLSMQCSPFLLRNMQIMLVPCWLAPFKGEPGAVQT